MKSPFGLALGGFVFFVSVAIIANHLVIGPVEAQLNPVSLLTALHSVVKDFIATGARPSKVWDWFLLDYVPTLFGQRPFNENGTYENFKDYLMNDISNDEVTCSSTHDMIRRAGWHFEDHYVMSADGYITELIRLINPKADPTKLKQPPVMLFHGGVVNPSIHVFASNMQHHPEKWPRNITEDGPITSWNRSLGFALSNNGYDVWLIGTRGADIQNHHKNKGRALEKLLTTDYKSKNMTLGENIVQIASTPRFWSFTFDDIRNHEIPIQIDKVLEVTGAKNVSLFAFSFMTVITLPMLSNKPDIAKKIHNYIVMAPIINIKDSNLVINGICYGWAGTRPEIEGSLITENIVLSPINAGFLRVITRSPYHRYTVGKLYVGLLSGSSAKYRTLLEPSVLAHIFQPISYKQVRHWCQMMMHKHYQKYDYNMLRNIFIYGRLRPARQELGDIHVKNWMMISGGTDQFAGQSSVRQVLREVQPAPEVNINIDGYGHLELLAAMDNDIKVVLPILKFLDSHHY